MEQNSGSHRSSRGNSTVKKLDAAMRWRGTEKAEKSGEWLETWLRGYAEFVKAQDHLPIMIMWKA